jgi:hypothetical protein
MAIRALNSVVVGNYDTGNQTLIHAGDAVMILSTGLVQPAFRNTSIFDTRQEQFGAWVGFASDDTYRTGNTMILNDPVGSSYVDSSNVLQAANNGFYVVAKRAIGDFQAENVNTVTNPTAGSAGYEGPRRGIGVYNTPGGQFVTDRFALTTSNGPTTDSGTLSAFNPGDLLTVAAAVGNSGLVVKLNSGEYNGIAGVGNTHGIAVGRVDKYDSAAGLLYFTQLSAS